MSFTGADDHIQRKVRRAYDYLKTNTKLLNIIPDQELHFLLKAIFIAMDEEFAAAFTYSDTHEEIIADPDLYDAGGVSNLPAMPYDDEA